MRLNWDDFRLLLAVARSGSASGAGRSLGINQSTVSRRIRTLEERVEVRLFEPLPSGLALTAAGEEVLAAAERMEREVEQVDRQVFGRDAALSGNVRVTVPEMLMPTLAFHLADFRALHPGISVHVHCDDSLVNLTKRFADVAIRLQNSPPEHLVGRRIKIMPLAPYASAGYLERTGVRLRFTPALYRHLAKQGWSPEYGARELRRMIRNQVENPLTEHLINGRFKRGDTVCIGARGNGKVTMSRSRSRTRVSSRLKVGDDDSSSKVVA